MKCFGELKRLEAVHTTEGSKLVIYWYIFTHILGFQWVPREGVYYIDMQNHSINYIPLT